MDRVLLSILSEIIIVIIIIIINIIIFAPTQLFPRWSNLLSKYKDYFQFFITPLTPLTPLTPQMFEDLDSEENDIRLQDKDSNLNKSDIKLFWENVTKSMLKHL